MSAEPTTRAGRWYTALGAATLLLLGFASYLGVRDSHPGATYLTATFDQSAQGLDTESDVKIRGINVGGVARIHLDPDHQVTITIRLKHGVRVPQTTTAVISPLSVFGPKYIDLQPGTGEDSGPYLADHGRISRVERTQDLTDIATPTYKLLGAISATDLSSLLDAFAQGLNGRGPELADTITNAGTLLGLTTRDIGQLRTLIDNTSTLVGKAASKSDQIGRLSTDLNALDGTISADPVAFDALLKGTSALADKADTLLDSNPGSAGAIIRSLVPAVGILYKDRATMPTFMTAMGSFLNQFAGVMLAPGPQPGTLLAAEYVHFYLNDPICTLVLGLCKAYPKPLPYPGK